MVKKLKIYRSSSFNPYENLATESLLLESVDCDTVILYLWQNDNTVVIGKNQNPLIECKVDLIDKENVFIARRSSGGGAVFHDKGNLNFTFIAQNENYNLEKQMQIIKKACDFANISTEISGRNDIVVNGKKISGNAFLNTKKSSLHHGTLLINSNIENISRYLSPNLSKLQSKGIKSVESRITNLTRFTPNLTCEDMCSHLIKAAEEIYNLKSEKILNTSLKEIEKLKNIYSSKEYIYGALIPYTITFSKRLSFGNLDLRISLKGKTINEIQAFTDSLDTNLPEKIKKVLEGSLYELEEIKRRLNTVFPTEISKEIYEMFL